ELLQVLANERARDLDLSERRMRAAAEAGQLAWMEMSGPSPSQELRLSENFRDLYDLPADMPVTFANVLKALHPDDRAAMAQAHAELAAMNGGCDLDIRLPRADGSLRWIKAIGAADPLRADGQRTITTVSFDITERKIAEEALAQSRHALDLHLAELEALYAGSPVGLALLDRQMRFVRVNPALAVMNGPSPAEHIGKSVWDLVPDLRTMLEPVYRRVLDTGDAVLDVPIKGVTAARPGEWRQWRTHHYAIRGTDGSVSGIGLICEEVTEQTRISEQLRAREELYHGIFRLAGTGIVLVDLDGTIQSCNPAFCTMMGRSEASLSGLALVDMVDPADRQEQVRWFAGLDKSDTAPHDTAFRSRDAEGRVLHVRAHGSVLHDAQGQPQRAVVLFTDVTAEHMAASRQQILLRELGHRSKNLMAIVQAIANRTFVSGADIEAARRAFSGRIAALAASQDALSGSTLNAARLTDILHSQLAPFGKRVRCQGPDLLLPPRNAQTCALIVHELATNAVKHGALSVSEGHVELTWCITSDPAERFVFHWRERGGPPGSPPARQGFGTLLITTIAGSSLNCTPIMTYSADGFEYGFDAPLADLIGPADSLPHAAEFFPSS
ncbi:MAG: PAS domain S-box protein, partial [Rhodobacteraceae bacterium]|nr:PAS domain S-box protein [Paracoccaceae bacterium]